MNGQAGLNREAGVNKETRDNREAGCGGVNREARA